MQKGCKNADMANVYMRLIEMHNNRGSISAYQNLRLALSKLSEPTFKFGLTTVEVATLDQEADLDIQEIRAFDMSDSDYMNKGQALIEVASGFASVVGDNPIRLQEMFKGTNEFNGTKESLILQACAYEVMGKGIAMVKPKQASEYLQMAYNFRRQIGDSGEEDLRLMKMYANSAKCWICGRPVAGESLHFVAVKSRITPMFQEAENNEGVKSTSEGFGEIYMCMPCYTSISNRADQIARGYHNTAMNEIRAAEARLQAQINSLRCSINSIR
ncbi:hypothetical protein TALC_01483 [Thermoplasmatales archaeon BRNA1]|nr:hypothetical protein TALC_01483 [Thermoplasmatales archaeon BRNA1]